MHDPSPSGPDARRWRALALLCLAQFMLIVDVTVVAVALPTIGRDLSLGRGGLTWVVAAYSLCFGGLLLLGGRLADTLGRRRAFLVGLTVFTAASLVSGLAWSGAALIGGRVAQGVGAALLSPAALSIITTTFAGPERNRALGVWAAIGGSGGAVGVLLGGLLTSGPGWQWIFFVNVPVGLAVLALVPRAVAPVPPMRRPLDLAGALTATSAAALLIFALVRAGEYGWGDATTLVPLGVAVAAATGFVLTERTARSPLVPLPMLGRRSIATGNLVMLSASSLLLASFFLSSQYLQNVLAYSAVGTGLVFLPVALAIIVGAHVSSVLIGKVGPRPVTAASFAISAAGLLLLAGLPADGRVLVDLLPGFLILAVGLGSGFVCATTTALSGVGHHEAGLASGIVNTGHEIGGAFGVALATALAGASVGGQTVGGFQTAFGAFAAGAAVVAVLAPALVPAGRPEPGEGPVFAH
ncbi:MAG TPA: MFS transporter [Streptosporangiaceae bacterium]|nr:MFS transporter [Streptosporangiaceae bacterium]